MHMYDILHTMNYTVSNVLLQKVQEPLYIVVIYSFFSMFLESIEMSFDRNCALFSL